MFDKDLTEVFKCFCENLKNRQGFLSEDNIRFYWFASMLQLDGNLNNYSLEEPYPEPLKGRELDLMYKSGKEIYCFEIKFHKHPRNEIAFAHPKAAGDVFNDIFRLPQWHTNDKHCKIRRFLLYVTDEEMHKYLESNTKSEYRQNLRLFYNPEIEITTPIPINIKFSEQDGVPKTFIRRSQDGLSYQGLPIAIRVSLMHAKNFECKSDSLHNGGELHVRMYEIESPSLETKIS